MKTVPSIPAISAAVAESSVPAQVAMSPAPTRTAGPGVGVGDGTTGVLEGRADSVGSGVPVGGGSGTVDAMGWLEQPAMKIAAARATNLSDERAAAPDRDCTREGYGMTRFRVSGHAIEFLALRAV